MTELHKSSSHVQMLAEDIIFQEIEKILDTKFEKNKKLYMANNSYTYIQPDFYSWEAGIVGEIFAHIGKSKKAQYNKISNDILKMLLLEKKSNKQFRKIIVVCDEIEYKQLLGKSVLAESIRELGIEIICVDLDETLRTKILEAQERQKMTNT